MRFKIYTTKEYSHVDDALSKTIRDAGFRLERFGIKDMHSDYIEIATLEDLIRLQRVCDHPVIVRSAPIDAADAELEIYNGWRE
jgi:hypothetical protein